MSNERLLENCAEHREVSGLIPWYINATLDEQARRKVDAHVGVCAVCSDDLMVQRRLFDAMGSATTVDYMPMSSLRRLQARLDVLPALEPAPKVPTAPAHAHGQTTWRTWMAASVAGAVVAVGLLAADRWIQYDARGSAPKYRTVTNAAPRPRDEVIRAVFSPTITLVELQSILQEAQLRIISGPTEAGVYSLASDSDLPVRSSLELLRRHSTVRFAEGTRPESGAGDSP
jgi:hypothetical protein